MRQFTIGKLARSAGVGVETVRFYQRKGLLRQPSAAAGFRTYSDEDARRIRFIKRAQELGFTLREITGLLELDASPRTTCADVKRRADGKLEEIDRKLRDLRSMKRSLKEIVRACGEGKRALARCRILDCYESGRCD